MAQWLRLLVALADNLNLVSTTRTVASKSPVVWQQNFWYALLDSAGTRHTHGVHFTHKQNSYM